MRQIDQTDTQFQDALAMLGLGPDADEERIRTAYVAQIRLHPPDQDAEAFERIRDAYEVLCNPQQRAQRVLAGPSPTEPLTSLAPVGTPKRRFVGLAAWMNVLKEKRS